MEGEYDVIVLGTGLTETIMAGLLAAHGKKVLHLDRNSYYGGESASINLTNLFKKFRPNQTPPASFDLIPKFIMANGKLVKIILHTINVARHLEWKAVDGTYVLQFKEGGWFSKDKNVIHKVPVTEMEALKSDLMGMFEKRRCAKFFNFASQYNPQDPKTHKGFNMNTTPFSQIIQKFQLEPNTIDFIGHAVALYTNDNFINQPAHSTLMKIQLYIESMGRYGNSPFIYPIYGIGSIPEGFSRLSSVYGGVYILNQPIDEILFENGVVSGVRSGQSVAKCSTLLCDPSYALNKVKSIGKAIRSIVLLNHPVPNTQDMDSVQIIIPQRQTGRQSDIYIMTISYKHKVCAQGYYIAICSTNVETQNPEAELAPAYELLGDIVDMFVTITDTYEPLDNGMQDKVFVSKSYDATSHFETACEDVLDLYKRIMGEDLNYDVPIRELTEEEKEEFNFWK